MKRLVLIGAVVLIFGGCSGLKDGNIRSQAIQEQAAIDSIDHAEVAAHLEQLAEGIDGVSHARCVIFGNKAVVGIDVDPRLDRSRVGTIKYSVAEAFHKDPLGIDALITADIDINQRLSDLGAAIQAGKPISGFAEEMADIIGRLMPQIPEDINEPEQSDDRQATEPAAMPDSES